MIDEAGNTAGYGLAAFAPPAPHSRAYELRPLSVGEILDRTFSLYRRRFWLYCGISAIPAALLAIMQAIQTIWFGTAARMNEKTGPVALVVMFVAFFGVFLLYFLAYALAQAATMSAVSSIYLGHETSIGAATKVVRRRWWRYILIAMWQSWSAVWVMLLLAIPGLILLGIGGPVATVGVWILVLAGLSFFYGIFAYLRNSLAVAASVFEDLPIRTSMRRSKRLTVKRNFSIFLLLLLAAVLQMVGSGLRLPFVLMAFYTHPPLRLVAQGLMVLVTFLTTSMIAPVAAIGLCLFYIDQRVRLEGFDIEALMDPAIGSGALRVPPPPPVHAFGFAPSGFTAAAAPFAPSGFTAADSPFPPSPFTAPAPIPAAAAEPVAASPFAPSGFTAGDDAGRG
jgi:hypothetical protein